MPTVADHLSAVGAPASNMVAWLSGGDAAPIFRNLPLCESDFSPIAARPLGFASLSFL